MPGGLAETVVGGGETVLGGGETVLGGGETVLGGGETVVGEFVGVDVVAAEVLGVPWDVFVAVAPEDFDAVALPVPVGSRVTPCCP